MTWLHWTDWWFLIDRLLNGWIWLQRTSKRRETCFATSSTVFFVVASMLVAKIVMAIMLVVWKHWWWSGPSVLRNFNPRRDGTRFFQNPRIPRFVGTGLTSYFHTGIDGIPGFSGRDQPKISIPGFFEFLILKYRKSLWNHCCVWHDTSQKILGFCFPKSRDRDLSSIPGSRDIPGSRWGLVTTGRNNYSRKNLKRTERSWYRLFEQHSAQEAET